MESCSGNDTDRNSYTLVSVLRQSLSNSSVNNNTLRIFNCKLLACNILTFPESRKLHSAINYLLFLLKELVFIKGSSSSSSSDSKLTPLAMWLWDMLLLDDDVFDHL